MTICNLFFLKLAFDKCDKITLINKLYASLSQQANNEKNNSNNIFI